MRKDFMTGEELLAQWDAKTREERLDQALVALLQQCESIGDEENVNEENRLERGVRAMMQELEALHVECKNQSLRDNVDNPEVFCSCADAYRMGAAALEGGK